MYILCIDIHIYIYMCISYVYIYVHIMHITKNVYIYVHIHIVSLEQSGDTMGANGIKIYVNKIKRLRGSIFSPLQCWLPGGQ